VTRTLWIAVLLLICLPLVGWLAVYGYAWRQDRLRIADAPPAFEPVLPLRAELLANPCGRRVCCYWLRFTGDLLLSDDNVAQIESLNLSFGSRHQMNHDLFGWPGPYTLPSRGLPRAIESHLGG
jgi:hypothetical protein